MAAARVVKVLQALDVQTLGVEAGERKRVLRAEAGLAPAVVGENK